MKKIIYSIALCMTVGFLPQLLVAQSAVMADLEEMYLEDDDMIRVSVSQQMFELFMDLDAQDETEQEILEAIAKIDGLKVLAKDGQNGITYFKSGLAQMKGKGFEELMSFDNKDERARFYIRKDGDKIGELFMLISGNNEFAAMTIYGDIDLSSITKIAKVLQIKGLDKLEMLND